jgi:hypothetical protein
MYIIEDDLHAELISKKFGTFDAAIPELHRIAYIPFGLEPNRSSCTGWQNRLRDYHIVEYDDSHEPWKLLSDTQVLEISETEIVWHYK